jgi:hypothetical protein
VNRTAKALLVAALVVVVAMAFRVSWNAQRDIATSVGADPTAALLYPFVVDGLMALALVATLVLTGTDRRFALRVLASYTVASLVLNYVHGLVPALHAHAAGRMHLADWAPANWALVLLATSLPVGSIFFGSDLVAKVLHHRPAPVEAAPVAAAVREPAVGDRTPEAYGERTGSSPDRTRGSEDRTPQRTEEPYAQVTQRMPDPPKRPEPRPHAPRTPAVQAARKAASETARRAYDDAQMEQLRQRAQQAYADSLAAGQPIGPAALAKEFGFSEGWGRKQIRAVDDQRARDRLHVVPEPAAALVDSR